MIEIKFYTDDITKSVSNKLKKGYINVLNKKLAPFEDEIIKCKGVITVKMIGKNNEADLLFKNMPVKLVEKIKNTLAKW